MSANVDRLLDSMFRGEVAADSGVRTISASEVTPRPAEFLWDGRLPRGAQSIIGGPAGLGKTTLLVQLIARVTRGQLAGSLHGTPSTVLFATAEDSLAATLVPRLVGAGAELERVRFLTMRRDGIDTEVTFPEDLEAIEAAILRHEAVWSIFDPLFAFISGRVDSHRDHDIRRVLAPLHHLAESTGAAITSVVHLNKSSTTDLLTRVGGSVGIGGAVRSALFVVEDPEADEGDRSARLLVHGKSNLAPEQPTLRFKVEGATIGDDISTSRVVWTGTSELTSRDVLDRAKSPGRPPDKIAAAKVLLNELLWDGGPIRQRDVVDEAEEHGISSRTLMRAKSELGIVSTKTADGWAWSLPTVPPPTLPET